MTTPLTTKSVLNGIALTAIAYGVGVLLLKSSIIVPVFNWLRSLTPIELDTYLSILARTSIAAGAFLLLAMIVTTRKSRNNLQQGASADENNQ